MFSWCEWGIRQRPHSTPEIRPPYCNPPRKQSFSKTLYEGCVRAYKKPKKKSPETAKPQEIPSKTEIKDLTAQSLSLLFNFYTSKLVLLSEVLSAYSLVSAGFIVV